MPASKCWPRAATRLTRPSQWLPRCRWWSRKVRAWAAASWPCCIGRRTTTTFSSTRAKRRRSGQQQGLSQRRRQPQPRRRAEGPAFRWHSRRAGRPGAAFQTLWQAAAEAVAGAGDPHRERRVSARSAPAAARLLANRKTCSAGRLPRRNICRTARRRPRVRYGTIRIRRARWELIAAQGDDGFYRGETADKLIAAVNAAGGAGRWPIWPLSGERAHADHRELSRLPHRHGATAVVRRCGHRRYSTSFPASIWASSIRRIACT
jgi:hypothetical protein